MDIYKEWSGYGFDSVEVINYTVLLSYPDKDKPNSLQLKDSSGAVVYDSKIAEEPPLTDDEKKPNVAAPFNAYSGSGTVTVCYMHVFESSFFREETINSWTMTFQEIFSWIVFLTEAVPIFQCT